MGYTIRKFKQKTFTAYMNDVVGLLGIAINGVNTVNGMKHPNKTAFGMVFNIKFNKIGKYITKLEGCKSKFDGLQTTINDHINGLVNADEKAKELEESLLYGTRMPKISNYEEQRGYTIDKDFWASLNQWGKATTIYKYNFDKGVYESLETAKNSLESAKSFFYDLIGMDKASAKCARDIQTNHSQDWYDKKLKEMGYNEELYEDETKTRIKRDQNGRPIVKGYNKRGLPIYERETYTVSKKDVAKRINKNGEYFEDAGKTATDIAIVTTAGALGGAGAITAYDYMRTSGTIATKAYRSDKIDPNSKEDRDKVNKAAAVVGIHNAIVDKASGNIIPNTPLSKKGKVGATSGIAAYKTIVEEGTVKYITGEDYSPRDVVRDFTTNFVVSYGINLANEKSEEKLKNAKKYLDDLMKETDYSNKMSQQFLMNNAKERLKKAKSTKNVIEKIGQYLDYSEKNAKEVAGKGFDFIEKKIKK